MVVRSTRGAVHREEAVRPRSTCNVASLPHDSEEISADEKVDVSLRPTESVPWQLWKVSGISPSHQHQLFQWMDIISSNTASRVRLHRASTQAAEGHRRPVN